MSNHMTGLAGAVSKLALGLLRSVLVCSVVGGLARAIPRGQDAQHLGPDLRPGRRYLLPWPSATAAAPLSLLALVSSALLWPLWVVSFLYSLSTTNGTFRGVFVADLVPEQSLGKGISRSDSTTCIAGLIGAAGSRWALQNLGCAVVLLG